MTAAYRKNQPKDMPVCETFDRAAIDKLVSNPNFHQLRIYYGTRSNGAISAILIGADAEGKDILPSTRPLEDGETNADEIIIVDDAFRCPPHCPPSSPLNP